MSIENGDSKKVKRGFASMDKEKLRQIASLGGQAAHRQGTAHQWTSSEARKAGRKGGLSSGGTRRQGTNDRRS